MRISVMVLAASTEIRSGLVVALPASDGAEMTARSPAAGFVVTFIVVSHAHS